MMTIEGKTDTYMRLIAERTEEGGQVCLRKPMLVVGQIVRNSQSPTGLMVITHTSVTESGSPDHMLRYCHYRQRFATSDEAAEARRTQVWHI